jgi:hypothetical protein
MSAVLNFYVENRDRMNSKTLTVYETMGAVTQKITTYTFTSRQLQVSFTVLVNNVYLGSCIPANLELVYYEHITYFRFNKS